MARTCPGNRVATARTTRTDPDAKLYRKSGSSEAKLSYLDRVLMENRSALIVDAILTAADSTAEAEAALLMAAAMREKRPRGRIAPAAALHRESHCMAGVNRRFTQSHKQAAGVSRRTSAERRCPPAQP